MERAQSTNQSRHHVRRADRVREPRVLGAGKDEMRHPELLDAPEPLHLGGAEQLRNNPLLLGLERDQVVHRVAEEHGSQNLDHPFPPVAPAIAERE